MMGVIVGDVVGVYFEHFPTKYTDFELFSENSCFTDDTVVNDMNLSPICKVVLTKYYLVQPR
jgi:hypothetical protein